ncbi:hypothetical protein SSBG_06593 [Streptomyces sp. SPB074]|nr:hypothetical protein SSBG_06593 [Streptomyces sp. SPB074]
MDDELAGAVGRAGDEVGRDGGREELEEDDEQEGAVVDAVAQPQRDAGDDQEQAERLGLGRGVAAREDVGQQQHPEDAQEALEAAEQEEHRPGEVGGAGPGAHRRPARGGAGRALIVGLPWGARGVGGRVRR